MAMFSGEEAHTVFEAFMYLHHPQTLQVKEMIQSGQLGKLQLINSWFAFYLPPENTHNIRLHPELAGGSLWDVGVYPLSFAQFVFGRAPLWVFGSQWIGDFGVDETFCGQMAYTGDAWRQN